MDTETEIETLKPIPPEIKICSSCKHQFESLLRTNAQLYKTCNECRHKVRLQGARFRKQHKLKI